MTSENAAKILEDLISLPSENEWVEFKSVKESSFNTDKIGKYFSALSNEAYLNGKTAGWLVLGVDNKRNIVGTRYVESPERKNKLKQEIYEKTNQITFREIHELNTLQGRVLVFEIPPAKAGNPTSWNGHWFGRNGESLTALTSDELERILKPVPEDWSKEICNAATLRDLDSSAITFAREQCAILKPHLRDDISGWDDATFLDKTRVTIGGKITNTAIVLLGKEESSLYLENVQAKITWQFRENNEVVEHQHFYTPFILQTNKILKKIPNRDMRFMPGGTLFPETLKQYDDWVIREALHNCIAHQDYRLGGKINIVQSPGDLVFSNMGTFIPGTIENALNDLSSPEFYRNHFLVEAMVKFRMIETLGSGIRKMFLEQRKRRLPMPDFDLGTPERVLVQIYGKILDEKYSQILLERADLDLDTVILLDKVQKQARVSKPGAATLRKQGLVEGRYPNLFPSAKVAALTDQKAAYVKNKGMDDTYYRDLILKLVSEHEPVNRSEINQLLMYKLPEILTTEQKLNKIKNLLSALSKEGHIINRGSNRYSQWIMKKNLDNEKERRRKERGATS